MAQFLITLVIFALGIVGMSLALHFSRYKKREESCCGGGHCSTPHDAHSEECKNKKEYNGYPAKIVTDTLRVK